jgi:TPR repeat protein
VWAGSTSSQHLARAVCLIVCCLCGTPALAQTYAEGLRAYDARDYAAARAAWAPLAALGHPEAMVGLAQLYLDGLGVEPDPERALALYRSAAEQGYTYAMRKLGVHYLLGEKVSADPAAALAWRLRAARAGDPKAQYEAAVQLLDGVGVERDVDAAVGWLRKAADAGVDAARFDLAGIFADPEVGPFDIEKAVELYETWRLSPTSTPS